ncbi:hypothetical protein FQA39_LY12238 [Lamprigera yunnana]|nr:hypothetical protein FQA39_LY12238 [Lamprigera yunnana]
MRRTKKNEMIKRQEILEIWKNHYTEKFEQRPNEGNTPVKTNFRKESIADRLSLSGGVCFWVIMKRRFDTTYLSISSAPVLQTVEITRKKKPAYGPPFIRPVMTDGTEAKAEIPTNNRDENSEV